MAISLITLVVIFTSTPAIAQVQGGAIKALEKALVASPKGGRIISDIPMLGALVKKGDVIARLDCTLEKAARDKYSAQHNSAAQTKKLRQLEVNSGVGTAEELNVAKARSNETWAAVKEAKASLNNCTIHSPINGEIVHVNKQKGEWVQQGEVVLELSNNDSLFAQINVLERNWNQYDVGQKISFVVTATGQVASATVRVRANKIDLVSHTFAVEADIDDTEGFAPGMAITVQ